MFILTVNDVPATLNVWFLPASPSFHTPAVAMLTFSTVTLQKDVAKIYKRYDVPQVEGFSADNIEVISENNTVTPVKVTLSQLAAFGCCIRKVHCPLL